MLKKYGSPHKIEVLKEGALAFDVNILSKMILDKWPNKKMTLDELHEAVKSVGIMNYSAEDMDNLINRLQSVGFHIEK